MQVSFAFFVDVAFHAKQGKIVFIGTQNSSCLLDFVTIVLACFACIVPLFQLVCTDSVCWCLVGQEFRLETRPATICTRVT